jgi:hypothetical protein
MFKQLRKHNNKYNTTMNIDDKLKNLKPSDTPLLVIGYIILGMFLLIPLSHANDNEVLLDQEGDNVVIDIAQGGNDNKVDVKLGLVTGDTYNMFSAVQIGNDNSVYFSVGGNNNDIHLVQEGNNNDIGWTDSWGSGYSWGGDLDGNNNNLHYDQRCSYASCQRSFIGQHIQGNSNNVRWGQGVKLDNSADTSFYYDGMEEGGKTAIIDIHGDSNSLSGWQASSGAGTHSATIYLYSDSNAAYIEQRGNGNKTLNLTTYNDSNAISIVQKDNAAHTATVVLNGSYSTTLDLLQQGTTAQGYSLTQTCATLGGCSISVTQE